MTGDLIKRGNEGAERNTQGSHYMKIKVEIGGCIYQDEECKELSAKHQKLGDRHGADSPSQPSEGTDPADAFILAFWLPEL